MMLFKLLLAVMAVGTSASCKDADPKNNLPPVVFSYDESQMTAESLPLLRITTHGQTLYRDSFKLVDILLTKADGTVDYAGNGLLRYHGSSSFDSSDKAPFYLKPCDTLGTAKKVSLLGMPKAKKWILAGPFMDRSCLRDKLIMDTFRPYFEWVPRLEPVEVVLDNSYRGIYYIEEKIGIGKGRLELEDAGLVGDSITGGYVIKADRGDETYTASDGKKYNNFYVSTFPCWKSWLGTTKILPRYDYVDPQVDDMVEKGVGSQEWLDRQILRFEASIIEDGSDSLVHLPTFAAYLLATEFAHNVDGYRLSTFFYKYRDARDPRWYMTLWDFDRSFGNSTDDKADDPTTWAYDFNSRHNGSIFNLDAIMIPPYWAELLQMSSFQDELTSRWTLMRRNGLDTATVFANIDSLHARLVRSGARQRNDSAYAVWTRGQIKPITAKQAKFKTSDEEIEYIKAFIRQRIPVMDAVWYDPSLPFPTSLMEEPKSQPCLKILRSGQVLIQRGSSIYTLRGEKIQ